MAVIHVPRPPKEAMNPNRPASALLKAQIEHLHSAERRLPAKYQTDIYVNAIRTEREAADYIGRVTAAIHRAHEIAARRRARAASRATLVQLAASEEIPAGEERSLRPKSKATSRTRRTNK